MRGTHGSASQPKAKKRHRIVKPTSITHLLLATDFSDWARRAEEYACVLAATWRIPLTVMTVLEFPPGTGARAVVGSASGKVELAADAEGRITLPDRRDWRRENPEIELSALPLRMALRAD